MASVGSDASELSVTSVGSEASELSVRRLGPKRLSYRLHRLGPKRLSYRLHRLGPKRLMLSSVASLGSEASALSVASVVTGSTVSSEQAAALQSRKTDRNRGNRVVLGFIGVPPSRGIESGTRLVNSFKVKASRSLNGF